MKVDDKGNIIDNKINLAYMPLNFYHTASFTSPLFQTQVNTILFGSIFSYFKMFAILLT